MSLDFLTNFETQKYYENEANFNGVYSSKGWSIYNKSIGSHWIALYVNVNNVTYFYSVGVEHIPKQILKL